MKCNKCDNKGWYLVNEYFSNIQGRKDCDCINQQPKKVGRPRSNKKKYLISCLPEHIETIRNFIKSLHEQKEAT